MMVIMSRLKIIALLLGLATISCHCHARGGAGADEEASRDSDAEDQVADGASSDVVGGLSEQAPSGKSTSESISELTDDEQVADRQTPGSHDGDRMTDLDIEEASSSDAPTDDRPASTDNREAPVSPNGDDSAASDETPGDASNGSETPAADSERDSTGSDNDVLVLDIPLSRKGRTVSLELRPNLGMPDSLPVYVATDKFAHVQVSDQDLSQLRMYQDPARQASFVTWRSANDAGDRGMMGTFEDDGETYLVEPRASGTSAGGDVVTSFSGGAEEEETFTVEDLTYVVKEVDGKVPGEDEILVRGASSSVEVSDVHDDNGEDTDIESKEGGERHRKKRSFYNYEVELFLIADYSIFKKWERMSQGFYYQDREQDAINSIRYYFAHVLNGIDLRYRTIMEYDYQVTIRPVGLYIAKTHSASFWTEYHSEVGVYVEAYRALDDLQAWINSDGNKLPHFDQVSLFTAYQLYEGYTNGRRRTFSGIADVPSVCGPLRASISHDQGQFSSIQTGAHELGHALGSYHDGFNGCSGRDQFIMASSPGNLSPSNMENLFHFSRCSIRDIRDHMHRLTSKGENCLLQRSNYYADRSYLDYLYEMPGQRYTADEQCKFALGPNSYYCGGGHLDSSICLRMYCYDTYLRRCVFSSERRAADGTMCGNQKWCKDGRCESDSRAPHSDKDYCFYGDYLGVVKEAGKDFMCRYIDPYVCYDELRYSKCCETCARLKDLSKPGCEFGDRERDYCHRISPADCYDANLRERCCSTCERLKRDDPQCEYGDRSSFCRNVLAYECYTINTTCCESCKRHEISRPGCQYGNRVQWCYNYPSRTCYQDSFRRQCCDRCCRDRVGSRDCPWGDRISDCSTSQCSDPSRWSDCCHTCAGAVQENCRDDDSSRSWCSARVPRDCYDSYVARTCCRTCMNYRTGPSSCPYGDHYSWCGPQHCRTDARHCCSSCPTRDTC